MAADPSIVVLAAGKRLHGFCCLPNWRSSVRLVGVWSPDPEERFAAAARYQVPTADTPATLLDRSRGNWVLLGGLATVDPAVTALERGFSVLAWPPFCAADDLRALRRLIGAARSSAARWRVARPIFTLADRTEPLRWGEHLPAPPEALRVHRKTAGTATSWDELYGRAAVALASTALDGRLASTVGFEVRTTATSMSLALEVRHRALPPALPLRLTLGDGPAQSLKIPSCADKVTDNSSGAGGWVARDWTWDTPSHLLEAAERHLLTEQAQTTVDEALAVLQWLRCLIEARG